jgi:hypothetical protein
VRIFRVIALYGPNRMLQQSGRLVQVQLRLTAVRNGKVLKPIPGMSVSVPAAMMRSSGCERAARLLAAVAYALAR